MHQHGSMHGFISPVIHLPLRTLFISLHSSAGGLDMFTSCPQQSDIFDTMTEHTLINQKSVFL